MSDGSLGFKSEGTAGSSPTCGENTQNAKQYHGKRRSVTSMENTLSRGSTIHEAARDTEKAQLQENWSPMRVVLYDIAHSNTFSVAVSSVIMFNMCLVVSETDIRGSGGTPPAWMRLVSVALLIFYATEIILRLYVDREKFFKRVSNCLDFCLVAADIIGSILETIVGNVPSVSVLRVLRAVRVVRIFRALTGFRELFMMLHGLAAAMKAIAWATIMIMVAVLFWSLIAVEVVQPYVEELVRNDKFDTDCARCPKAFSTVWGANLTLLQTVLAGDSWGKMAIPLASEYPGVLIFFLGSFVSVNLGILNLIVAVIVDRAHQAREEDDLQRLNDKQNTFQLAMKKMGTIFEKLDLDADGLLTCDELVSGMESIPDFANLMSLMDISAEDLQLVFKVLDRDGSGELDYMEFCEQLYKMKMRDTRTLMIFVRHQVSQVTECVYDILDLVRSLYDKDRVLRDKPNLRRQTSPGGARENTREFSGSRENTECDDASASNGYGSEGSQSRQGTSQGREAKGWDNLKLRAKLGLKDPGSDVANLFPGAGKQKKQDREAETVQSIKPETVGGIIPSAGLPGAGDLREAITGTLVEEMAKLQERCVSELREAFATLSVQCNAVQTTLKPSVDATGAAESSFILPEAPIPYPRRGAAELSGLPPLAALPPQRKLAGSSPLRGAGILPNSVVEDRSPQRYAIQSGDLTSIPEASGSSGVNAALGVNGNIRLRQTIDSVVDLVKSPKKNSRPTTPENAGIANS